MDKEPAEGNVPPAWRERGDPIKLPEHPLSCLQLFVSFKEMEKLGCLGFLDINPFVGVSSPRVRGFLFGWPWNQKR